MEVENISLENLRIQHAHLDAVIKEEESHIWKNCIKIEELKKQYPNIETEKDIEKMKWER